MVVCNNLITTNKSQSVITDDDGSTHKKEIGPTSFLAEVL